MPSRLSPKVTIYGHTTKFVNLPSTKFDWKLKDQTEKEPSAHRSDAMSPGPAEVVTETAILLYLVQMEPENKQFSSAWFVQFGAILVYNLVLLGQPVTTCTFWCKAGWWR